MRKVLIATPCYDSRADIRFIHSFGMTLKLGMAERPDIDIKWLFPYGDAIIQNARNGLVADALKHDFDDLIFIDSDQDWEAEWIFRLLDYPVDCVGAAVRRKTDDAIMFNVKALGGVPSFITDPATGLMTAPDMALGTGFLRLSRKALQVLWDNAAPYTVFMGRDEPWRWIFDVRPYKGELRGEDTFVSDRLREFGIQTWLDPNMTCGHIGLKRYAGDFAAEFAKWREHEAQPPTLKVVK